MISGAAACGSGFTMGSIIRRIVFYIILALIADRLVRLVYKLGFHKTVHTHHPGLCRGLAGIENGSEDIVTSSTGLAFISSGIERIVYPDSAVQGKIFLFDFKHPSKNPQEVQIKGDGVQTDRWFPVGMDILESGPKDNPKLSLYIINRQPDRVGIEVFDFSWDKKVPILLHKRTIQDKNIWRPNDLVVVGQNRFYASNDGYLPAKIDFLETLLSLRLGSVVYFDGNEARIVAEGIQLANGINVSPDKKHLYVSASTSQNLHIYTIGTDGGLDLAKLISLATVPDNIDIDKEDGSLWVGCNPILHTLFKDIGRVDGAGQVLNIKLDENLNPSIREVFADSSGLVRGSSVACRYGNAALIGTIADKATYCEGLVY